MTAVFVGYGDVSLVGQGGLGRVYRATRLSTGGLVAIKELPDVASASSAWHRARRELEALLRLKGHAGVVSVEEIFEGPNGPCIVMEFMPGGSLHDRLKIGPLSVPEAVLVGQQVSLALRAAHDVGIVHRDVKPHNLMVSGFGQVKVCDFGISALIRGEGDRTQTHAMTLAYASPEELDGSETVGPAADVYSFAATMQHLMTGRKPTFHERLGGDVPQQFRVGGPVIGPLAEALGAGLNRHPSERPTMAKMVLAFDAAASTLGTSRISSLPIGAEAIDQTVKRSSSAPPEGISSAPISSAPISSAPITPVAISSVPMSSPPMTSAPAESAAARNSFSPPPFRLAPPTRSTGPLPSLAGFGEQPADDRTLFATNDAPTPPVQQHYQEPAVSPRRWDRYVFASIALVVVVVAALILIRDRQHADTAATVSVTSPDTEVSTTDVATTRPASTVPPATVVLTAAAPVTLATVAPTAVVAPTVPTELTTAAPVVTVIVTIPVLVPAAPPVVVNTIFIPPTPAPTLATTPPTEALISPSLALATLRTFFSDITANNDYSAAWHLTSANMQAQFKSFDRFQCIWSQFTGADITRIDSTATSSTTTTVVTDITFTFAGGTSRERLTIPIVDLGQGPQLDHYASKALVSGPQIQPCP